MSILVFGKTGQVARELALHPGVICLGRDQADLSDPEACGQAILAAQPTAVINAAAYTAVDAAEEEEELAMVVNGATPGEMALTCLELGIPFVTISTDYVFDGTGETPWTPKHATGPLGAYGRTKLAGEQAVAAAGGAYGILRTSWVVSAHGHNFVKTMLRLGVEREALAIVGDQVGGPTPARAIAGACLQMAGQLAQNPGKSGVYHFAGGPDTSWANFARAIFALADITCRVTDIPSADYPTPAARPLNSRMDCTLLETVFDIPRPDWQAGLRDILKDLGAAA